MATISPAVKSVGRGNPQGRPRSMDGSADLCALDNVDPARCAGKRPLAEERMARRKRRKSRWTTWLRRMVAACVVVALLPLALSLLYVWPAIHPVSTLMVRDLVTGTAYQRRWVPIEEIAPVLIHSVMMSEDGQFCSHRGIDWGELNVVIDDALSGEPTRGASTIPMQTVKNLFLWHGRSLLRKAIEAPLALIFDAIVPKKRIMEIYLNIVEWAPGVYGAEAAAQHHFNRSAAKLTRRQSALLAVTLPNPAERNPAKPGKGLARLASIIEKRAAGAGDYVGCVR